MKPPTIICLLIIAALAATTYQRNKVWSSETGLWEDVVSKSPKKLRGYSALALAYTKHGDYSNAVRVAKEGLLVDPKQQFLYVILGNAYMSIGSMRLAIDSFNGALQYEKSTMTYGNLGNAYFHDSQFSAAGEAFWKSVMLDHGNLMAADNFVLAMAQAGRRNVMWDRIDSLESDIVSQYAIGRLAMIDHDFVKADRHFEEAAGLLPIDRRARSIFHFQRGYTKDQLGDTDGAIAEYHESVLNDPIFTPANLNYAIDLAKAKRFAESRSALKPVLDLDATNPQAKQLFAFLARH